jgi:segregation and condensation protein B
MGDAPWQRETPVGTPPKVPAANEDVPPPPRGIVEAMLFVGGAPLSPERACEILRGLTIEQFESCIDELNHAYRNQNRPYSIRRQAQGYVLALLPRYQFLRDKLFGGIREARLSTAAVDVLALVAYRQPTTKVEVDSLRGADSGSLLKQLIRRGLVQIVQRGDAAQKEVSYGTTQRFLDLLGLASLEDLPHTQDLQEL